MPDATPKFNLPFPIDSETPDVPRDIAALAAATELAMGGDPWHVVGDGPTGLGTVYGIEPVSSIPWAGNVAFTRRGGLTYIRGAAAPLSFIADPPPPVFVLPLQYRPPIDLVLIVAATEDIADDINTKLFIYANGNIVFFNYEVGGVFNVCFPAVIT